MKSILIKFVVVFAFLFAINLDVSAQADPPEKSDSNAAVKVLKGTGKVAEVAVVSTGKAAYATTKFAAKNVAKPVLVKAVPAVGKFVLKKSGNILLKTAVKSLPIAKKIAITYVKLKLPI